MSNSRKDEQLHTINTNDDTRAKEEKSSSLMKPTQLNQDSEQLKEKVPILESEKEVSNKQIETLEQTNKALQLQIDRITKDEKVKELMDENTKLKDKMDNLKRNVFEIKQYLENDVFVKLELKSKLLKESLDVNRQLEKKVEMLETEQNNLQSFEDQMHMYRDKFNEGLKEKIEIQKLNQRQDSTIKALELDTASLQSLFSAKTNQFKELKNSFQSLNKIFDERNKVIYSLKEKNKKKEDEIKGTKMLLHQKEQEILFLKNIVKSTKSSPIQTGINSRRRINLTLQSKITQGNSYDDKQSMPLENISKESKFQRYTGLYKQNASLYEITSLNSNDEGDAKLKEVKEMIDVCLKIN